MNAPALTKHVPLPAVRRTRYGAFEVTPISPHIGAEIRGVDLSRPQSPETLADIRPA